MYCMYTCISMHGHAEVQMKMKYAKVDTINTLQQHVYG